MSSRILSSRFKRLVIWGLRSEFHSHRFIHLGFWTMANKLGLNVVWLDNKKENNDQIYPGDLVIAVNVAGSEMPVIKGASYVLHNFYGHLDEKLSQLLPQSYINLQVYTNRANENAETIGNSTYWNPTSRTLLQPWGTPILEREFAPPSTRRLGWISFWVGSVWNNEFNQGNKVEYDKLKKGLADKGIKLLRARVPERLSAILIRHSALAPAVGGIGKLKMVIFHVGCLRMYHSGSWE